MPFTPLDLIKYAFAIYVTYDFVKYARSGMAKRHMTVFAKRSAKEWAQALGLVAVEIVVVVGLIGVLMSIGNPVLNFSWLNLLVTAKDDPNAGTNLMVAPAQIPWFGAIFGGLLAMNMPRLARREEEMFRRGTRDWKHAAPRSLHFGLIHMIVGVPLAAGLALSLAGLFFSWRYFAGGVRESSFYHTLHNYGILILLAAYFISGGS